MGNEVEKTIPEVDAAQEDMALIAALLGGTRAMRKAGGTYLPRRSLEDKNDYDARLASATLYPALSETVATNTGRVFAEPLAIGEDVPTWIQEEVLPDIDREGRKLDVFAWGLFFSALSMGLTHVLVESPPAVGQDGAPIVTRDDEKREGFRPYTIHISHNRIIGWKQKNGKLVQVRIWFERQEDNGEFGTNCIPQIRVYTKLDGGVSVRCFEKDSKGEWVESVVEQERMLDLKEIPLVTFYTNRTGFMQAIPPLRELAFLNVKHWQQQSDSDELLHTASVPILVAKGLDEKEGIVVGAKCAICISEKGDIKYVEHNGSAIGAGVTALKELKDEMREAGAKLVLRSAGTKTATQVVDDADTSNSALGRMVRDFEDSLALMLDYIAMYRSEEKGGTVEAQPNLDPELDPIAVLEFLHKMTVSGNLSDETLFEAAKRLGLLPEDLEWEDEQEKIQNQPDKLTPPMMPGAALPPNPNDPNNPPEPGNGPTPPEPTP